MKKINKVADLENKWKRALADYDNLQKRIGREKEEFIKFATCVLIDKILAVLSDLERAQAHLKDQGLELAIGKLKDVLKKEGLEEIEVSGKKFDTQLMECVEKVKGEENKIIEVVNKGYLMHGRVLRPAQVKVGGPSKRGSNKNE